MKEKLIIGLILIAFLFSIGLIKAAEYNTYLYTNFSITQSPRIMKLANGDFLILTDKYFICKDILNNATCFNITNSYVSNLYAIIDETKTHDRIRFIAVRGAVYYFYQTYNTLPNYTNFTTIQTSINYNPNPTQLNLEFPFQKGIIIGKATCKNNGVYSLPVYPTGSTPVSILLLDCFDINKAVVLTTSQVYPFSYGNSIFLGNASLQPVFDYYDSTNYLTRATVYYCTNMTCSRLITVSDTNLKYSGVGVSRVYGDVFYDDSGNVKTLLFYLVGGPDGVSRNLYMLVYKDVWGPINNENSYIRIILTNISTANILNFPFWLDENTFIISYDSGNSRLLACKIFPQTKRVNCNWFVTPNYALQFTSFPNQTLFFENGKMHLITVRNISSNTILINYKIYDVLIDIVDEITLIPKTSNVVIFKSDGKVYDYSYNTSMFLIYELESDNYLMRVGNEITTYRFYSFYKNSHLRQTTYLLDYDKGLYYTFYVTDYNNIPIQNATVTVYLYDRELGAWVVATRNKVNPDGSFSAFLRYGQLYKVLVTADGYNSLYFDYVTDPNVRTIFIRLSKAGTTSGGTSQGGGEVKIVFNTIFDSIIYRFEPSSYYNTGNITIKYTINDKSGSLEYFKMQIYKVNLTGEQLVYDNTIYTSPQGGELSYTTSETAKYKVIACFKKQNQTEYCHMPQFYFVYSPQAYETEIPNLLSGGAYLFIALIITALVSGFFAVWFGSYTLAFLVGAGVFGVFVALNPFALVGGVELYKIYIITLFVVFAFIFIKSYI